MKYLVSPSASPLRRIIIVLTCLFALCPPAARAAGMDEEKLAAGCTSCHGIEGRNNGAIPALAGQDGADLIAKLTAFKARKGDATIMNRIAVGYSDAELEALADYFSKVKP